MKFDINRMNNLVVQGWLKKALHPYLDITIYNYSEKTQYTGSWGEITLACRGLVLDYHGNVVARPFKKFFNVGQVEAPVIPDEPFEVYDKMDGSLIIMFKYKDEFVIASRGSFISDQAMWAREIVDKFYPTQKEYIRDDVTYLFELIHPRNRIVVDYKDEEDLYLLAVIDNETGKDLAIKDFNLGFPVAKKFDYTDLENLPEEDNSEGYVVKFESGTRLKIKNPRYMQIHRVRFDFTKKRAWEALSQGIDPTDDLEGIPDEFFTTVEITVDKLLEEYASVAYNAQRVYNKLEKQNLESRKDKAIWINKNAGKLKGILFQMISGKDISDSIWKMIKPGKEHDE